MVCGAHPTPSTAFLCLWFGWFLLSRQLIFCSADSEWWEDLYCTPPLGLRTSNLSPVWTKCPLEPKTMDAYDTSCQLALELCPDYSRPGLDDFTPAGLLDLHVSLKHLGITLKYPSGVQCPKILLPWFGCTALEKWWKRFMCPCSVTESSLGPGVTHLFI